MEYVTKGMPVIILPSLKDKEVNDRENNPLHEEKTENDTIIKKEEERHTDTDTIKVAPDSINN
mgnify:FL=1